MFTRTTRVIALTVALSLSVAPAFAGPTDKAQGNAWAWGLQKKAPAPAPAPEPEPAPVPVPVAEQLDAAEDFEDVLVYAGPLDITSYGFWVKLYRTVNTGYLGYARPINASGITAHFLGETPMFREYSVIFDADPSNPSRPGWNNPDSRITYAYEGFTSVTVNGVSHPLGSAEAAAALATPGMRWSATYREMWSSNGYHTPTAFNGWAVLEYTAIP